MESYFFIPANRLHKIESIKELSIDKIIIDLEDAIKFSERDVFSHALKDSSIDRSCFIRVPIYDYKNILDLELYFALKKIGYTNFIFPKLQNYNDVKELVTHIQASEKIIILVETPLLLLELKEVLSSFQSYFYGVGLGSHDLMNIIGGEHTLENIEFYRNKVLLYAKAYQLKSFDIASMELEDEDSLKAEILNGFKKGFDAKFYIHPWQIIQKDKLTFYNDKDLNWAIKINEVFQKVGNAEEFNPIVVDGEIIEKPHLNKVFTILKYFNQDASK